MAIRPYINPGVNVTEQANPALSSINVAPTIVAIVGAASGNQSASERVVLTGTTASDLRYTGVDTGSVVVKNGDTLTTVNPGAYTVDAGADPDATVTGDKPYTITRVATATAPTLALGTGTLAGTYRYAVAFVNANGITGIGTESATITPATEGVSLSAIALGPTGTTARNIYREKVVASVGQGYHLVATINDNTTTTLANETTIDATADAAAAPVQGIDSGDTVVVSYDYTDQNYYTPTLFDDFDDIADKYGAAFDADGLINSDLTFGARVAMLNGAREIMCVAAASSNTNDLQTALESLEDEPDVRMVVVLGGDSTTPSAVSTHCTTMKSRGYFRQGIVARDGSSTVVDASTLRTAGSAFNEESIQMVGVSSFYMDNPVTGRKLNIGAHFAAAGIAGMYAARDPQISLTRLVLSGFKGYNDVRTLADLALDSKNGLLAIENKGGVLRVRHNVTTAVGNLSTSEGSVVRAKYEMAHRLQDVLDRSLIGITVSIDHAPLLVRGATVGVLDSLVSEGIISGYNSVKARVLVSDPTTVEVKFGYTPMFPINNINVVFQVDTTSGEFALAA